MSDGGEVDFLRHNLLRLQKDLVALPRVGHLEQKDGRVELSLKLIYPSVCAQRDTSFPESCPSFREAIA